MALNIKITVLLHVTPFSLVNRFPSFLGNVLPLSSRSNLNAAGSYETLVPNCMRRVP